MKTYPSISKLDEDYIDRDCYIFKKYDGSNLRFSWSHKKGWHKYGSRHQLIDRNAEIFGCAIDIFHSTYAKPLEDIIKSTKELRNTLEVTAFCEFFGPNSFSGLHDPSDDKQLILFDLYAHKKGVLGPKEFLELTKSIPVAAKTIYEGLLTQSLIDLIRAGDFIEGEGVIAKGGSSHKLWMCKIKTEQYLEKLKLKFGDNWEQGWE